MSSFVDFNQRVLGNPPKENKFLTDLKNLLESTKATLDKEQTTISAAKRETAGFADEVLGLKEKICNVERIGLERLPSLNSKVSEAQIIEESTIANYSGDPDFSPQIMTTATKHTPRSNDSELAKDKNRFISDAASRHPAQLYSDLKTKDDTLLTLVKTNAALSRQLEDLRQNSREQERSYFDLLKLVDAVTSVLLGDVPLTKPTSFYIEERQRSLLAEIKSLNDKLRSMHDVNSSLMTDVDEIKGSMKKMESENYNLKSRLSLSESQTQLLRSERDRVMSEIQDLKQRTEDMKREGETVKEQYARDLNNLREDFKRKFKATVWNQSGQASGVENKDIQMVVWLDESSSIDAAKKKLSDAADSRDLSSILAVMSSHNDRTLQSSSLQEYACSIVAQLALDVKNHADIITSELLDAVLESMKQHLNSSVVQQQGIKILNSIGVLEASKAALAEQCISCIVQVLRVYSDEDVQLLEGCLVALCNLCNDSNIPEIIEVGLDDILRIMRKHAGVEEIQRAAYETLHILSSDDANAKVIGERCLIEIIETMRQQEDNESLQESACSVLCNLARDEENRGVIMELGLADILFAMRKHKASAGVQEKACAALGNLAADENNTTAIAEEGLADILEAISQHLDRGGVVQYACTALWYLTTNPAQLTPIAEYGLDLLLAAVTNHIADSEVVGQACGALLNLSLDPKSRELMMASGCADVMRAVVQQQGDHPDIPALANRILSQLLKT